MIERHRGDVLILASTASFQAVPYISTYAATKAFDLLFAEGLAEEMKPYGIRVCALVQARRSLNSTLLPVRKNSNITPRPPKKSRIPA